MKTRVRIMLVDDHEVVRGGIRRLLEQVKGFEVVAEAASGEAAYQMMGTVEFDVAVVDISLPGMSGIETVRRMRVRNPRAKLLIFSVHESASVVQRALDAGANGYLSKASVGDEMATAVHAVSEGRRYLGSNVAQRMADLALMPGHPAGNAKLTRREFEVLRLFSSGHNIEEAASALHVSPKTVANTLSSIKGKLGARSHADIMRLAMEQGKDDLLAP
jgi:DNA-binding NarL/FixJ family response regulator